MDESDFHDVRSQEDRCALNVLDMEAKPIPEPYKVKLLDPDEQEFTVLSELRIFEANETPTVMLPKRPPAVATSRRVAKRPLPF